MPDQLTEAQLATLRAVCNTVVPSIQWANLGMLVGCAPHALTITAAIISMA